MKGIKVCHTEGHGNAARLTPPIDDGIIDEVIRSLKSGKQATVCLERAGSGLRCAKGYRDIGQQLKTAPRLPRRAQSMW